MPSYPILSGGFSTIDLGNPYVRAENGLEICESF